MQRSDFLALLFMSFTLMVSENKQCEIIHREILLIILIIKRDGHCYCDSGERDNSFCIYERAVPPSHKTSTVRGNEHRIIR